MYLAAVWESEVMRMGRAMVGSQLTWAVVAPRWSLPKTTDSSPVLDAERPPGWAASGEIWMAYLWPRACDLRM
jgi:hypothetical protein